MDKKTLDEILDKHKAQPVGNGYIDIIVSRDNYINFILDLVTTGYIIKNVSWWEWCPDENKSEYGMGGPKSNYFNGWFSELSIGIDYLKLTSGISDYEIVREIINIIETKIIAYPSKTITFKDNQWLTPAFWLDVPEDWRTNYLLNRSIFF